MKFIDFRDTCVITRGAEEDEWENSVDPPIVYEGPCLYQEGGTGYSRQFVTRTPTLFIPGVDVLVRINDAIEIKTEFGRKIKSLAKIVRDINMPWRTDVQLTRIELKQAQGE